jgi:bacterial leucyl aminopeptidase
MYELKFILFSTVLFSFFANAFEPKQWVTIDSKILNQIKSHNKNLKIEQEADGVSLVQLTENEISKLSSAIHDELHRCGGFMAHESEEEALLSLSPAGDRSFAMKAMFSDYTITNQQLVNPLVAQVQANLMEETIEKLSSFHNRFHKAGTGLDSQAFVLEMWKDLTKSRSDITVEYFRHSVSPQPSVIMTIEGSDYPNEIIVLGGHADSIVSSFLGTPNANGRAPGADDNASGIATITETVRILVANNYKPKRTIQVMAYAAEEVGLLGSKDIANTYKAERKNVIGKIQFDMTLRKGTADKDIVLMSDFTNANQNAFIGRLIDEYVKVPWGYSRCGYGCSDHASWTNAGFPASIPFESEMRDSNKAIHTARDTMQTAGGDASHAAKFAKLAVAYVVELSN